jgi:hypothetical protein
MFTSHLEFGAELSHHIVPECAGDVDAVDEHNRRAAASETRAAFKE